MKVADEFVKIKGYGKAMILSSIFYDNQNREIIEVELLSGNRDTKGSVKRLYLKDEGRTWKYVEE